MTKNKNEPKLNGVGLVRLLMSLVKEMAQETRILRQELAKLEKNNACR